MGTGTRSVMLLCAVLALGGCNDTATVDTTVASKLKLCLFDCGRIQLSSTAMFSVADHETYVRQLMVRIGHSKALSRGGDRP
jgi:hypothetical protein